jgi:hypothetical protein
VHDVQRRELVPDRRVVEVDEASHHPEEDRRGRERRQNASGSQSTQNAMGT